MTTRFHITSGIEAGTGDLLVLAEDRHRSICACERIGRDVLEGIRVSDGFQRLYSQTVDKLVNELLAYKRPDGSEATQ